MSSGRLQEVKNKLKRSGQQVVAVAYEIWSFTRGSNYICRALIGKNRWSLMGGARRWRLNCSCLV